MKDECVSRPKTQQQLAQMDDDDENVFATSTIDRYAARHTNFRQHVFSKICSKL